MGKKVVNTTNNNISSLQAFVRVVETNILGYHVVPDDKLIRYQHGGVRPKIEIGLVLEWHGPIKLCEFGLHASLKSEDAKSYCTGILTKVACSGEMIFGENKLVCSRREILEIIE